MKIQSIQLEEAQVVAGNAKQLEQAVQKAVQGALDQAQDAMNKEMDADAGMNLPGMKLLFNEDNTECFTRQFSSCIKPPGIEGELRSGWRSCWLRINAD